MVDQQPVAVPIRRTMLTISTVVAFLVLGWSGGAIGPALPWLTGRWRVSLDEGGALFTALFLGALVTVGLSGLLLDRWGPKPVLVAGLLLMAAGVGGLSLAPGLPFALAGTLVLGLGWGCLDVTLNVFAGDLYPGARTAVLNLMNGAYGAGALAGPLTVGAALEWGATPEAVLLAVLISAAVTGLVFLVLRFPAQSIPAIPAPTAGTAPSRVWRESYVLTLTLLLFLYVGVETGFGGWAYSFAQQGAALAPGVAALVVSAYWTSFTLGRLGAGLIAGRIAGPTLILGGLGLAATGMALLGLFSAVPTALFAGAALVGLGCAPVFPTAFALASARYAAQAGAVSSLVMIGGSLGGVVLPYVIGRLLVSFGVIGAAGFLTALLLVVLGLQLSLSWRARPRPTPVAEPAYAAAPCEPG